MNPRKMKANTEKRALIFRPPSRRLFGARSSSIGSGKGRVRRTKRWELLRFGDDRGLLAFCHGGWIQSIYIR